LNGDDMYRRDSFATSDWGAREIACL
jgi:hypothetical protein